MPTGFALAPFDEDGFGADCAGLIVADRYDAEMIREAPCRPLAAARRKAETLRFARRAARRLAGDLDPALAGLDLSGGSDAASAGPARGCRSPLGCLVPSSTRRIAVARLSCRA